MHPFFPFRFHPHSQNWTSPTLQQLAEEKMAVAHAATEMAACTRRNRWPLPLPFSVVPSCSTKPPNVPASACLWISESLLNHQQYVSCERPQNASRPYQQQQICINTHPYTRSNAFFFALSKTVVWDLIVTVRLSNRSWSERSSCLYTVSNWILSINAPGPT